MERDSTLFHGLRIRSALLLVGDQYADLFGQRATRDQVLGFACYCLGLCACVGASPEFRLGVSEMLSELDCRRFLAARKTQHPPGHPRALVAGIHGIELIGAV